MKTEESVNRLLKAKKHLEEASELVGEALHMSGMEARGKGLLDALEHYSESREDAGSIPNLIADMASSDDDPCWTRPYASVKYFNRKNI